MKTCYLHGSPKDKREPIWVGTLYYTKKSGGKVKETQLLCQECKERWEANEGKEGYHYTFKPYEGLKPCPKCGGSGLVPIPYANGVCFKCNGTGKSIYSK